MATSSLGSDSAIRLWSSKNGRPVSELRGHYDCVRGLAFSPDEKKLYVVASRAEPHRTIVSYDVTNDGTITAWQCHNYNSGQSALRTPYRVANQQSAFHAVESPLRQGSYRALAATANLTTTSYGATEDHSPTKANKAPMPAATHEAADPRTHPHAMRATNATGLFFFAPSFVTRLAS